jgi:hypothetical protein
VFFILNPNVFFFRSRHFQTPLIETLKPLLVQGPGDATPADLNETATEQSAHMDMGNDEPTHLHKAAADSVDVRPTATCGDGTSAPATSNASCALSDAGIDNVHVSITYIIQLNSTTYLICHSLCHYDTTVSLCFFP